MVKPKIKHKAPLDQDAIPDENQTHYCMSCNAPLGALYCGECGQKNDDFRRRSFSLLFEIIGSLTSFESRIWRTWRSLLFRPGKVAREFANGKRSKWSSPVRVYLAISFLLFGYMGVTGTQLLSLDIDVKAKPGVTKPAKEWTVEDVDRVTRPLFFETKKQIEARNAGKNFELIEAVISSSDQNASIQLGESGIVDTPEIREARQALAAQGADEQSQLLNDVFFEYIKNPATINDRVKVWLPRLMFFTVPFAMLIGAIFIRGRENALLFDHLVHATYVHAVAFFIILLGMIFSAFMSGALVLKGITVFMLIYLPVSQKRMFKRGWVKTIWSSYGTGFIYLVTFMVLLMIITGWQFTKAAGLLP